MLTLEFELLTHVYRAMLPDGSGPDWPPHPDRVFSALVQAWGDGGEQEDERQALEWLEGLKASPVIEASPGWFARDLADVYVPPNDTRSGQLALLPEKRPRHARSFAACIPEHPTIRLQWEASPPGAHETALRRLARRVASLGHPSSLVRCWVAGETPLAPERTWRPDERGLHSLRSVYPGRLADLVRWYRAGRRPLSRSTVHYTAPDETVSDPAFSSFGSPRDWFVFEGATGDSPDVLGFAHVARRFRQALMSLAPQPTPEALSGHAPDGSPSQQPHAAIAPLVDVGWDHSRGGLLGIALVLPREIDGGERDSVLQALARFARIDEVDEGPDHPAVLQFARFQWPLRRVALPERASLRPGRWCGTGRTWASATPIVLDRFADDNDPAEEAACIARSCRDIGLPEEPVCIEIHKYSALRGAPEAYPARGVAYRPSWAFPESSKLAQRPRRHVCLQFAEPVTGPVILGAGRYQGFGLCLPLSEMTLG